MNKTILLCLLLIAIGWAACNEPQEKSLNNDNNEATPVNDAIPTTTKLMDVTFYASDSLPISGKLYQKEGNKHCILYCHQATYNKAEYHEIASKLLEKGYNGLAIDQRSGGTISNLNIENKNETFLRAKKQNLPTQYLDAEQDIIAAIDYLSNTCNQEIILWGSSYSASLALKIGVSNTNVKAIVAFSPGEYFRKQGLDLKPNIAALDKPTFVTSSNPESNALKVLISDLPRALVTQFIPATTGKHGSKALWESHTENKSYWNAIETFLSEIKR
jgi:dienelactone hydrolase